MKVSTLNYEGLTEQWKVDALVSRAKRMGFHGADLEDVQQEIIGCVIQFQYDPAKSNGASESTALTAMIDNQLKQLLRKQSRYSTYKGRFQKVAEQAYEPSELNLNEVDVRIAVEEFPHDEQAVCDLLSLGCTRFQIRKQLGIGREKLDRLIRQIRDRFTELGFDEDQR